MSNATALAVKFDNDCYSIFFDEHDQNIAPVVLREQTWEPWQLEMYRRTIQKSWTCVDVGANVGVNAIAMSRCASDGKVHAFEPVELTHSLLLRNIEHNEISNVTPYKFALGAEAGTATIWANRAELGRASITQAGEAHSPDQDGSRQVGGSVQVRPLDDWWDELQNPRIDFIKIDVEGFEQRVLAGAKRLLAENPDALLICEMNVEAHSIRVGTQEEVSSSAALFARLRELFRHIFFMGRDLRLYEVHSYSQLRIFLMHGHPVDDLFCCNVIPEGISDLIETKWIVPDRLTREYEIYQASTILFVNRSSDGWTAPIDGHKNTQSAAVVVTHQDTQARLLLLPIYSKHAGPGAYRVSIYKNNESHNIDLTDNPAELVLQLAAGTHWIFVETDFSLPANSYLGNPQDSRTIGTNLRMQFE